MGEFWEKFSIKDAIQNINETSHREELSDGDFVNIGEQRLYQYDDDEKNTEEENATKK